ncbi:MAG TPA: hypothetical protein VFP52_07955 [Myxococcales bacterium]|nr:hypothetical protein [Myxococcales bacterium]
MTGQVHWITLVIVLIALSPVIAFWVSGRIADRKYRDEESSVRCRAHGNKQAECTVVRDARTGEAVGIKACSEFPGAEAVGCARECLPLFKHTAA